ncbi:hypothetical protein XENTR_v10005501 [Xenopus tropicalis]|nr:hypothetical protein XENTR_v10005501 [Xenopus tropicalis]
MPSAQAQGKGARRANPSLLRKGRAGAFQCDHLLMVTYSIQQQLLARQGWLFFQVSPLSLLLYLIPAEYNVD